MASNLKYCTSHLSVRQRFGFPANMPRNMCLTRTLRFVRFGSGLGFPQTCHGACASQDTRLARIHLSSYEADQFTRPPQAPYALPAVWTGSMQLLGRQPCFMGLDTHAYLSKARTWHTATLLIGSPRPRGDRTPGAATLSALIGSPRPRGDRPQVRQPYQEHCCLSLWSPVRDRVTDSGTGPRCSNFIRCR